jgi:hypothetical protein
MFFRDLMAHLRHSDDQFIIAPGVRGMVMLVFTLPSYPYVFKIIKDVFAATKEVDHDRATVKANTCSSSRSIASVAWPTRWSSRNVALPKSRFSDELLEALRTQVAFPARRRRRRPDHQAPVHRAPHDAAQPLSRCGHAGADRSRRSGIRQRHPRTGQRQHLPRRHAVEELRRHQLQPRRLLRLRRNRIHDRLQLPRHPRAAVSGNGDVGRALVFSRRNDTSSPRSSPPSCLDHRRCAKPSSSITATCSTPASGKKRRRRFAPGTSSISSPTRKSCASATRSNPRHPDKAAHLGTNCGRKKNYFSLVSL